MRGCNQMTSLTSPHHMAVARVTVDSDDLVLRYEVNSDALQFSFLDASWTPASWQFRDVGIDFFFFGQKGCYVVDGGEVFRACQNSCQTSRQTLRRHFGRSLYIFLRILGLPNT